MAPFTTVPRASRLEIDGGRKTFLGAAQISPVSNTLFVPEKFIDAETHRVTTRNRDSRALQRNVDLRFGPQSSPTISDRKQRIMADKDAATADGGAKRQAFEPSWTIVDIHRAMKRSMSPVLELQAAIETQRRDVDNAFGKPARRLTRAILGDATEEEFAEMGSKTATPSHPPKSPIGTWNEETLAQFLSDKFAAKKSRTPRGETTCERLQKLEKEDLAFLLERLQKPPLQNALAGSRRAASVSPRIGKIGSSCGGKRRWRGNAKRRTGSETTRLLLLNPRPDRRIGKTGRGLPKWTTISMPRGISLWPRTPIPPSMAATVPKSPLLGVSVGFSLSLATQVLGGTGWGSPSRRTWHQPTVGRP